MKMKKSMLETLTKHYKSNVENNDNGGHAVCFHVEESQIIQPEYYFPRGTFILHSRIITESEDFCHWHYKSKDHPLPYDALWDKEEEFVLAALEEIQDSN